MRNKQYQRYPGENTPPAGQAKDAKMPGGPNGNWVSLLMFCWVTFGLMAGCASTQQLPSTSTSKAPQENVLRVGISPNAPPLIFKQGNQIVGLEADFAREFAQYLGKSVQFVELDWEDQIPALLENRIDIIMSGMSETPLREVRITFVPYFESGLMAMIRRADEAIFRTGFFSLTKDSAIGVIEDTTGEYFVETQFAHTKRKSFSTAREAVNALIAKKIDLFIHDAPVILYLASENEAQGLTPVYSLLKRENLAWGIRKNDADLLTSANAFLKGLYQNGRLKQMIRLWIPFTE